MGQNSPAVAEGYVALAHSLDDWKQDLFELISYQNKMEPFLSFVVMVSSVSKIEPGACHILAPQVLPCPDRSNPFEIGASQMDVGALAKTWGVLGSSFLHISFFVANLSPSLSLQWETITTDVFQWGRPTRSSVLTDRDRTLQAVSQQNRSINRACQWERRDVGVVLSDIKWLRSSNLGLSLAWWWRCTSAGVARQSPPQIWRARGDQQET